jgi:hypothetical protein
MYTQSFVLFCFRIEKYGLSINIVFQTKQKIFFATFADKERGSLNWAAAPFHEF